MLVGNPFENIKGIETADELMDISISRSLKIKPPSGKMSSLKRSQVHEINRINTIVNIVADRIRRTVTSFPSIDQLHPFYTELSGVLTDLDNVKENLGRLNGSILTLRSIEEQLVTKILESGSKPETKSLRRIAFARFSSVVHRINVPLVNLEASRAILQSLPSFNPYLPSVVVCGFPNSGKSSFVKLVSSGKPEVASYPFTTKKIIFGHKKIDFLTVQFVDTPGILDRPLEDRNEIELQALVALKHLSDVMLFLIDVASSASFGLEGQMNLLKEIKEFYSSIKFLPVITKSDLIKTEDFDKIKQKLLDNKVIDEEEKLYFIHTKSVDGTSELINHLTKLIKKDVLSNPKFKILSQPVIAEDQKSLEEMLEDI